MKVHPYGAHAVLILLDGDTAVAPWLRAARHSAAAGELPHVVDVVPGARSLVIVGDVERTDAAGLAEAVAARLPEAVRDLDASVEGALVEVPVRYDGADLGEVATRVGLTTGEVVSLHAGAVYEVAFCGFSPGFAYLAGLPAALQLPRRASPRERVPAGSVAIAAAYSAVYPQASPGGWWLLGSTTASLWEVDREPPALLRPGDRVRFVAEGG